MRNAIRFAVLLSALTLTLACGSPAEQQAAQPHGAASATPPAPTMMPMDVASGTELELILETPVSSETAKSEQAVRARVGKAVIVAGMTVIAEGAPVTGTVVAVERAGRVKGRASVALRFTQVIVANTPYDISTARIVREAEAAEGEDARKIGIPAGAGTGAVLTTRGDEVTIPAGATLRTTIQETVRINAPM